MANLQPLMTTIEGLMQAKVDSAFALQKAFPQGQNPASVAPAQVQVLQTAVQTQRLALSNAAKALSDAIAADIAAACKPPQ